jgi:hypothetical protein
MSKGGARWQEIPGCAVSRVCGYITDDGTVASYFGISREEVRAIRARMPKPKPEPDPTDRYAKDGPALACDSGVRHYAATGSERLRDACLRTGQAIAPEAPKRRLTFAEQLALVASGRAGIIDLDRGA